MAVSCSNEENHPTVYLQGALDSAVHLTKTSDDVTRKYSAMALRFMATNPQARTDRSRADGPLHTFFQNCCVYQE